MGKIKIGYCYARDYFHLISKPPEKLQLPNNGGRRCPAITNAVENTFVLRSPFTIILKYQGIDKIYLDPKSTLTDEAFDHFISVNPVQEWLNHDTPLIQFHPQIIFITDEEGLQMETFPPFLEYRPDIPGRWTATKFNIYNWMRNIGIVFEWMDTSKTITINAGEPLMYVRFDTDKEVELYFIKDQKKTKEFRDLISVHSHLKRHIKFFTKESMNIAGKLRPKRFL